MAEKMLWENQVQADTVGDVVPISNNQYAESRHTQAWELAPPPPGSSKQDEETAYHLAPPLLGQTPPEHLGPVGCDLEHWGANTFLWYRCNI